MPDPVQLSAFDKLLDYGVLGIAIVFLIGAVMWLTKKLFATQDQVLAAKEAHKDDAIKFATMTEVFKNQMQTQAELMKMTLETLQDRGRT
jgi:alpha-acetolactate decarboxylase